MVTFHIKDARNIFGFVYLVTCELLNGESCMCSHLVLDEVHNCSILLLNLDTIKNFSSFRSMHNHTDYAGKILESVSYCKPLGVQLIYHETWEIPSLNNVESFTDAYIFHLMFISFPDAYIFHLMFIPSIYMFLLKLCIGLVVVPCLFPKS